MRFLVLAALTLLSLVDLTTAWSKTRVEKDFDILDLDRDGKISKDEGQKFMDLMLNRNTETRKNFWEALDTNRNGEITKDEFNISSRSTEIIKAAHELLDTNEDGFFSFKECTNIVYGISNEFFGSAYRKDRWRESFYEGLDEDNDGQADYQEFWNFMVKRHRPGPKTEYQEEYELLNNDEVGFISRQEVQGLLFELRRSFSSTEELLAKFMDIMDIDMDGMVDELEYVNVRGSCEGLKEIFRALVPADRDSNYLTKEEILALRDGGFHFRINADNLDRLDYMGGGYGKIDETEYLNFMGLHCDGEPEPTPLPEYDASL